MRKLIISLCAVSCSFSLLAMESAVAEQRLVEPEAAVQVNQQNEECRERTRQILGVLLPESQDGAQRLLEGAEIEPFVQESTGKVLQLKVANQFGMKNGDASCGYQALYNALLILKLIQTGDPLLTQELLQNLETLEKREHLFGTQESPWQKFVLQLRAKNQNQENADWLRNEEIDKLIEAVCIRTGSYFPEIFVLGDIERGMPLHSHPLFQRDNSTADAQNNALKFMSDFQDPAKTILGAFIIYTVSPSIFTRAYSWFKKLRGIEDNYESMTQTNTGGHWYSIVVNKIGDQVQYITTDSAFNESRTEDFRVLQLMELLGRGNPDYIQNPNSLRLWAYKGTSAIIILAIIGCYFALKKQTKRSEAQLRHSMLLQLVQENSAEDEDKP